MIADQHQVTRPESPVDPAGGIGHEERTRAERVRHAHRKRRRLWRVSLVQMKAPGEGDHRDALERPESDDSRVTAHSRGGKAGHLSEGDLDARVQFGGESAEPGTEDQRQSRGESLALGGDRARSLCHRLGGDAVHARHTPNAASSPRTAATSARRSSYGRKALSNPFSAIRPSSADGEAERRGGVYVLVGERHAAHQPVVGVEHDVHAAIEVVAQRMRGIARRRASARCS